MARFRFDEAEHYGGTGGGGYFSLKDDGDTARVRFLYHGIEDVEGYAVHEVELNGKKRYINCKRAYNQPVDDCPFCAAQHIQLAKLFIPIYNIEEDRIQIWERGKTFLQKISSLCARYGQNKSLVEQVFEIERNGKAGSKTTTYEIYPIGQPDGTTFEDLPERQEILGTIVLDKSEDDMEYYLKHGEFPDDRDSSQIRRRDDSRGDYRESRSNDRERRSTRRTPSSREEAF